MSNQTTSSTSPAPSASATSPATPSAADTTESAASPSAEEVRAAQVANRERSRAGQAAIKRLGDPVRSRLRIGQLLVVVSAVLAVAPYASLVQLGDVLVTAHDQGVAPSPERVRVIVMMLVSAFTTRLLLYFVALLITHVADLALKDHLRRQIVERLSHAPLVWFTASSSGRVRKAVQDDTNTVHTIIAHGPVEQLNAIVFPLSLLVCAFWIDWRLALLAVATIPLYVLTYSLTLRGMNEKTVEMDRKLAAVSATMVEFVSGISVVKAFGRVGRAHAAYLRAADDFSRFFNAWSLPLITVSCLSFTWVSVPVILLVNLGGGALLLHAGLVTLPQVLVTTLIALVLPAALITVVSISWSYQIAGAAALRVCEILDTPVLSGSREPYEPDDSRVEIDHISFSYGDILAVDDVSLTLEPGTVTALLGPSGSGKSTLATLIARFSDPDDGAVRIGGVDLRDMEERVLYDNVSFVLQDAQIISASVRDNIALGRPDASLEEVREAARVARIDDVVMALPTGYETVIGRDTALSGGQEQRIAIARAVLADNPVLLLDEATAMADPESEDEIQRALTALVKGRTVLVIAHRPAAVRGADLIVVMERGRIVAAGRHEDLLDEPHYRALLLQGGGDGGPDDGAGGDGGSTASGAATEPAEPAEPVAGSREERA